MPHAEAPGGRKGDGSRRGSVEKVPPRHRGAWPGAAGDLASPVRDGRRLAVPRAEGSHDRALLAFALVSAGGERGAAIPGWDDLHSQGCPSGNFTNPVAVLERRYLRRGHDAFPARVVAIAAREPR